MISTTSLLAESQFRTYFELSPLVPITEWWHGLILIVVLGVIFLAIAALYFLDGIELRPGVGIALGILRVTALLGVLVFFLNPEKHRQEQIIKNTRVPVIIDTSSSMGSRDIDLTTGEMMADRRIDHVFAALFPTQGRETISLIDQLREQNDVALYRFDEQPRAELVASFTSLRKARTPAEVIEESIRKQREEVSAARRILGLAVVFLFGSLLLGACYAWVTFRGSRLPFSSFLLTGSVGSFVVALSLTAWADLSASDSDLMTMVGLRPFEARLHPTLQGDDRQTDPLPDNTNDESENLQIDVRRLPDSLIEQLTLDLEPKGSQTRLGDAIIDVVRRERGRPVAGVVVITDGQKTEGVEVADAARSAIDAGVRFFPIGIGNPNRPREVRVVQLQAPQKVFPGDKFLIKGIVQAFGYEGQSAQLELLSRPAEGEIPDRIEYSESLEMPADGEPLPIDFELDSGSIGRRVYTVRLIPSPDDFNEVDNLRSVTVDVIERQNRVLLIAGGPNRDYRFLRNQLYRDEDTVLHVYLQTASPGVAQESDKLLFEFPRLKEELYEYDCIIAFDVDWRELDQQQAELLETWVAEQAGGLVVVAGPVFTPKWTRAPRGDATIDVIRGLYPVSFFNQGSANFVLGRFGGEEAFPLRFSREGRSAPFLWIRDTALESQTAWDDFAGVYGYYAVNESKAGAVIYAEFSDPNTSVDGKLPIYLAGHLYGAGRVYFQASAELWRLRAEDVDYFQQYYTKLIHWASQGRLSRNSRRGILVVDKTESIKGDPVTIQAILRDDQDRPLELPLVDVVLTRPDGSIETLNLQGGRSQSRPGTYVGRYLPKEEGNYVARLAVPNSSSNEVLNVSFSVSIPLYEQQQPERNDAVLTELAEATNGIYVTDPKSLTSTRSPEDNLASLVRANDEQLHRVFLPAQVDMGFSRQFMVWSLVFIVTILCTEWTLRRLHRLA